MTFETQLIPAAPANLHPAPYIPSGGCAIYLGDRSWRQAVFQAARESATLRGDMVVSWTGPAPAGLPHGHLADLVDQFAVTADLEAPGLTRDFAPELAALRGDVTTLQSFALPASERRLSRESEFNFRILSNGVRLIEQCLETLPTFSGTGLLVMVPDLDRLDRLALLAVDQLRRRSQAGAPITVICGLAPEKAAGLDHLIERCGKDALDVDAERARFLKDFLSTTQMEQVTAPPAESSQDRVLAPAAEVFPDLEDEVPALLKALDFGQFDTVLYALTKSNLPEAQKTRLLGLAHAYLGNFELALQLYRRLHTLAETAIERARATVYVALLLNKRLNMLNDARVLLEASLTELATETSNEARLEKGWLLNGLALVLFRSGENDKAFACCRQGLGEVARVPGSDAMHLKVNIINNLSALCEARGDITGAAKIWDRFRTMSAAADSLFRKVYLYRTAALTYRQGNLAEAFDTLQACWREADLLRDVFHQTYIAYDLGVMSAELGRDRAAQTWFERARVAAQQTTDTAAALQAERALRRLADPVAGDTDSELALCGTKLGRPFHLIHVPSIAKAQ